MKIGITIGLHSPNEGMWVNGIKQNAVFLMITLRHAFPRAEIFLANTTSVPLDAPSWNVDCFPVYSLEQRLEEIDLLLVLGGAISQEQTDRIKSRGGKIVGYKCGSEYVISMECTLFDREIKGAPYYNHGFDELWIIPQVADLSLPYFQTMHRAPAKVVPFVWDPFLIEEAAGKLPNRGLYNPDQGTRKRLSIMEPNTDVLKFFLYPLMIAEEYYRGHGGECLEFVSVTNTEKFRTHKEFLGVVSHCDLVRDRKCFFEDRFETAWFLANHTDIVISHQWANPLNYAYLEACWLGYPFVHNAELILDLGYFYPGFDVMKGAERLAEAIHFHDERGHENYRSRQRENISRFLATDDAVVSRYRELVQSVMSVGR